MRLRRRLEPPQVVRAFWGGLVRYLRGELNDAPKNAWLEALARPGAADSGNAHARLGREQR